MHWGLNTGLSFRFCHWLLTFVGALSSEDGRAMGRGIPTLPEVPQGQAHISMVGRAVIVRSWMWSPQQPHVTDSGCTSPTAPEGAAGSLLEYRASMGRGSNQLPPGHGTKCADPTPHVGPAWEPYPPLITPAPAKRAGRSGSSKPAELCESSQRPSASAPERHSPALC